MKRVLFILLLLPLLSFAQYVEYTSAVAPVDGGSNTATTLSVTPPAGINSGDLIVFVAAVTITGYPTESYGAESWVNKGGQNIILLNDPGSTGSGGIGLDLIMYYCVFNGTWTADPTMSWTATSTAAKSLSMFVFRKRTSQSLYWSWDGNTAFGGMSKPTVSPYTYTGGSLTTTKDNCLVLMGLASVGTNTWGNPGTGWTKFGGNSLSMINTAEGGASIALVYRTGNIGTYQAAINQTSGTGVWARGFTYALRNYGNTGMPLYFFRY
jgi:hypothetical protein